MPRAAKGPPFTRRPKPGTWEFFCNHANEVPNVCPCEAGCGCRFYHCKIRPRVPEKGPTTPRDLASPVAPPVVSARRDAPSRPTARKGDPNQTERRKGLSSRVVPPTVGAEGAGQRAVQLAFYAGWAAGLYDGMENDCRMFEATPERAWAKFLDQGD